MSELAYSLTVIENIVLFYILLFLESLITYLVVGHAFMFL